MQNKSRDTRVSTRRAEWGSLQQGVVFSGATADNYEECEVYGLIITAQCDLAQAKVPVINFIPVVTLRDWLCRDFASILLRRLRKQAIDKLKTALQSANLSPSILETQPASTVVNTFFDLGATNAKDRKVANLAHESKRQIELCDICNKKPSLSAKELLELKAISETSYRSILRECLQQKLAGYYFLPAIDPNEPHSGYVVLLRQIYHVSYKVAPAIANGADARDIRARFQNDPASYVRLNASGHSFVMPIGQLVSPFLEHLMQAFAMLYSRIGVQDLDNSYESSLIDTIHKEL